MPKITFEDSENTPKTVPPGEYICEIVGFEFGMAKSSGNDMLTLTLQQEAVNTGDPSGCLIFDNLVFTAKAQWRFDTLFKCFLPSKGVNMGAEQKGKVIDVTPEFCEKFLLNARGFVKLVQDNYNNRDRMTVEAFLTPPRRLEVGTTPRRVREENNEPAADGSFGAHQDIPLGDENDDIPF